MNTPTDSDRLTEEQKKLLTVFDLDKRYGPALGLTRLERWNRAERLGLNPPTEVRELLDKYAKEEAKLRPYGK